MRRFIVVLTFAARFPLVAVRFLWGLAEVFVRGVVLLARNVLHPQHLLGDTLATIAVFMVAYALAALTVLRGAPRALLLSFFVGEIGVRYWIYDVGVPWYEAFAMVTFLSTIEQGAWMGSSYAISRNWEVWGVKYAAEIERAGALGKLAAWIAEQANAGEIVLGRRWQWAYRRCRFLFLYVTSIVPSLFLALGMPLVLRDNVLRGFLALVLGNATKMFLSALGWQLFPTWFWVPVAGTIIGAHIIAHRIKKDRKATVPAA